VYFYAYSRDIGILPAGVAAEMNSFVGRVILPLPACAALACVTCYNSPATSYSRYSTLSRFAATSSLFNITSNQDGRRSKGCKYVSASDYLIPCTIRVHHLRCAVQRSSRQSAHSATLSRRCVIGLPLRWAQWRFVHRHSPCFHAGRWPQAGTCSPWPHWPNRRYR
jgi:hypothetical protein